MAPYDGTDSNNNGVADWYEENVRKAMSMQDKLTGSQSDYWTRQQNQPGIGVPSDVWHPGSPNSLDVGAYTGYQQGIPAGPWQDLMNKAGQSGAAVDAARGLQASGRGGMQSTLQGIANRPLESQRLGQMMMQQGQQQVAQNLASQLASMPGRYNPAAARQAQMGMASAGQNMALTAQQQALAAQLAEQNARDQALVQGYGAMDANDIKRLAAEQDYWDKQQQAKMGWGKFGMADKTAEQANKQAYEQAKYNWYFSRRGEAAQGGDPTGAIIGGVGTILGSIK